MVRPGGSPRASAAVARRVATQEIPRNPDTQCSSRPAMCQRSRDARGAGGPAGVDVPRHQLTLHVTPGFAPPRATARSR